MNFVSFKYVDIPSFLHSSKFYETLRTDEADGELQLPSECSKIDLSVDNVKDLDQMIRTMVFWGLDKIPVTALDFCAKTTVEEWAETAANIPDHGAIHQVLTTYFADCNSFKAALNSGRKEIVSHWLEWNQPDSPNAASATPSVAAIGDLKMLIELHERGYPLSSWTCVEAAMYGHLHCLTYLHENHSPWTSVVCEVAAMNGHIDCLRYAHEHGCPWDTSVCVSAAQGGRFDCSVYAHDSGSHWDERMGVDNSTTGHLECLQYAHEHGCPWDEDVTSKAAFYSNVECLRYALQHACPVEEEVLYTCSNLECLQLLREHDVYWDEGVAFFASGKNPALFRYVIEQDCPYYDDIVRSVTVNHQPDSLKFLVEDRLLQIQEEHFSAALVRGYFACVEYLVDTGCSAIFILPQDLSEDSNQHAQIGADVDVLRCIQYSVEHGWECNIDLQEFVQQSSLPLCQQYMSMI